ncbi:MAG: hypothetical protein KGH62_01995 [Candidatus Micrarchaeota archaeon]|nr:hypothetical protein [Candidatus Micrarchaeota archaeon]
MARQRKEHMITILVTKEMDADLKDLRAHGQNTSLWIRNLILRAMPEAKKTIRMMVNDIKN